jgi:hypothetical protein
VLTAATNFQNAADLGSVVQFGLSEHGEDIFLTSGNGTDIAGGYSDTAPSQVIPNWRMMAKRSSFQDRPIPIRAQDFSPASVSSRSTILTASTR